MTYVITAGCIDVMDRACVEVCPVDCIRPGQRMLHIDPETCIECGACEPACPQNAIFHECDVPPEMAEFIAINAAFHETGQELIEHPSGTIRSA